MSNRVGFLDESLATLKGLEQAYFMGFCTGSSNIL